MLGGRIVIFISLKVRYVDTLDGYFIHLKRIMYQTRTAKN